MTPTPEVILAIDVGTSELKAGLVERDGSVLVSARAAYPIDVEAGSGRAEQDPEVWWSALEIVVRRLMGKSGGARVVAICCVGQGPTFTPVDDEGRATHAALTWMDARTEGEADAIEAVTGLSGWRQGLLPAAKWLEREAPEASSRTRWYLNSWEWATLRLTGAAATTRSTGQQLPTQADVKAAGLRSEAYPRVVDSGSIVADLSDAAARVLGLTPGLPVVAGTVDSFASFHGAGLREPGDSIDTGGTSGGLAVYTDTEIDVAGAWVAPAPLAGRWMVGGAMNASGKGLGWFDEQVLGGHPGADALLAEAADVTPGADGLIFLPYLAGERSPIWDPLARGALIGLTLAHGRAHIARAILESAAFALRHVAVPIAAAGIRMGELRVSGGTARSEMWNQIKADVLGIPVAVPLERETAVVGAAILAAVAIGWYPEIERAIECMVRIDHRLQPEPANRAVYDRLFAAYVDAWPALAPIVHRLHAADGPRS